MARRRSEWEDDDDDLREEFDFGDDDEPGYEPADDTEPDDARDVDDRIDDDDEIEEEVDEEEIEAELPQDNQDAIRALRELGARVDLNEQGRVWRVFLYEKNKDNAALQIHGFPMLREIWLLGSKVSPQIIEKLREAYPKARVFA
jgi:hypothetical protein